MTAPGLVILMYGIWRPTPPILTITKKKKD